MSFYYRCGAVDRVDVAGSKGLADEWAVSVVPGVNPTWAVPHLQVLAREVRTAMAEADQLPVPNRIAIATASPDVTPAAAVPTVVTLDDVLAAIEAVEGFRVFVGYAAGRKVQGSTVRDIVAYPYRNALKGEKTVAEWKADRFLGNLELFAAPEYVVQVLDGNGDPCSGQRKLRTVRESYP